MKMIIAMALLVTSFAANADIYKGRTITKTSITTLAMNGIVTYDKLCLNGDKLQTKEPRKVCVGYKRVRKGGEWENVCNEWEMQIVSRDLDYTKTVCVRRGGSEDRCLRYKEVEATLATDYTVSKVQYRWQGKRRDGRYVYHKTLSKENFEVPACN